MTDAQLATMPSKEVMSSLILKGDISGLSPEQRVQYITSLCDRLGVDPLTQPFKILKLQGREVLYADKGCTQQLCKLYDISTEVTKKEKFEDVYVVTVRASSKGRFTDEDGVVTIGNLKGDILANALMKAVTKAKRRAVLAFCGLGMLDESEVETIPNAYKIDEAPLPLKPVDPALSSDEQKITSQQGQALLTLLKNNDWDKEDLRQMISFEFDLEKINDICNKHLPKIKEWFSKRKEDGMSVEAEYASSN